MTKKDQNLIINKYKDIDDIFSIAFDFGMIVTGIQNQTIIENFIYEEGKKFIKNQLNIEDPNWSINERIILNYAW